MVEFGSYKDLKSLKYVSVIFCLMPESALHALISLFKSGNFATHHDLRHMRF